jgi:deoxyadenosine/deoxycytidine kinase
MGAPPVAGKRFIAIAGNIGAGKTELTRFLCKRYDIKPFYEPNEQNPYLADFYRDMKAWAYKSQVYFLAHKFRLQLELQDEAGTVVQDRTIYEDAEIFAKNLYRQRTIDTRDFKTYWALYRSISRTLRPPDLMIQLSCPVRTLRRRIRLRGRAMEREIPVAYLSRLNRLYEEWFKRYDLSPVLKLETDRLDWLTDLVDRVDLFRRIERYLG